MSNINDIKNQIQEAGLESHRKAGGFSTLAMCTGAGKSRCGVLRALEVVKENPNAKILLVVPTIPLRDEGWKNEFLDWAGGLNEWHNNLTRVCYVSLDSLSGKVWDLVIFDEFHHITENHVPFLQSSDIKSVLGLTATPPTDKLKKGIIDAVAPISFVYPLEQGVKDGVVAPYEIEVIFTELERVQKTVDAGSKAKPFKQSEFAAYQYWDKAFEEVKVPLKELNDKLKALGWTDESELKFYQEPIRGKIDALLKQRMPLEGKRFRIISKRKAIIKDSLHKERIAKRFIDEVCQQDLRYLFFGGSIPQAEKLLPGKAYHSQSDSSAYDKFMSEESNILITVDKLNEGSNVKNLNYAFIIQNKAKELVLIQRVGRAIRFREGHVGKIIIVCLKGTQDEVWLKEALKSFNKVRVKTYTEQQFFAQFQTE